MVKQGVVVVYDWYINLYQYKYGQKGVLVV